MLFLFNQDEIRAALFKTYDEIKDRTDRQSGGADVGMFINADLFLVTQNLMLDLLIDICNHGQLPPAPPLSAQPGPGPSGEETLHGLSRFGQELLLKTQYELAATFGARAEINSSTPLDKIGPDDNLRARVVRRHLHSKCQPVNLIHSLVLKCHTLGVDKPDTVYIPVLNHYMYRLRNALVPTVHQVQGQGARLAIVAAPLPFDSTNQFVVAATRAIDQLVVVSNRFALSKTMRKPLIPRYSLLGVDLRHEIEQLDEWYQQELADRQRWSEEEELARQLEALQVEDQQESDQQLVAKTYPFHLPLQQMHSKDGVLERERLLEISRLLYPDEDFSHIENEREEDEGQPYD